jgi:hypothetical protein
MLGIYLQRSWIVLNLPMLFLPITFLRFRYSASETPRTARRRGGVVRDRGLLANTLALQLCVSVPIAEILAVPAQELSDCVGCFRGSAG